MHAPKKINTPTFSILGWIKRGLSDYMHDPRNCSQARTAKPVIFRKITEIDCINYAEISCRIFMIKY